MEKIRNKIEQLKKIVKEKAVVNKDGVFWVLDVRNVTTKSEALDLIADIFWDKYEKEYPFQVGGQEISAIPIISAILLRGEERGRPVNGFILRKSRKMNDLQKIIEGELDKNKIILVDDLINRGFTISRQIKVLENSGGKVSDVFVLARFRDDYDFLKGTNIKFNSLFSLNDLGVVLNEKENQEINLNAFEVEWQFQSPDPNLHYVIDKSAPAIDESKVYFGADNGYLWALNQSDGSVAWKFKTGYPVDGKIIFSSPAIYKDKVYFGSYDGNFYALDCDTGKLLWKFSEAEWISSSPVVAPDINTIFIGLEYGIFHRRGGIAAIDLDTGEKKWDYWMDLHVPSSPAYSPKNNAVVVGCNNGYVYLFDAKTGKLRWKFKTEAEVKSSFTFDEENNTVIFGSFDGSLYIIDVNTGEKVGQYETKDKIWSTPLVYEGKVYFTSLDKNIYCVGLKTGILVWRFMAEGRIFSSPKVIEGNVFVGANDGRLYEFNPDDGKIMGVFQATERITSAPAYNEKTKRFFVLTYANEMYCIHRK